MDRLSESKNAWNIPEPRVKGSNMEMFFQRFKYRTRVVWTLWFQSFLGRVRRRFLRSGVADAASADALRRVGGVLAAVSSPLLASDLWSAFRGISVGVSMMLATGSTGFHAGFRARAGWPLEFIKLENKRIVSSFKFAHGENNFFLFIVY